jgi:hypothetical protein
MLTLILSPSTREKEVDTSREPDPPVKLESSGIGVYP